MSSVSGVSSLWNNQYQVNAQNNYQQFQQNFNKLGTALQSDDLSGAQAAFSALTQSASAGSQTQTTQQNGTTGIQADLDALGQALQAGDVNSAQNAYTKLQQDLQNVHGHRHHHHHPVQGTGDQNTPTTMDPVQNNGVDSNDVINLIA